MTRRRLHGSLASAVVALALLAAMAEGGYAPCYVHKGCETGIGYCDENCCDDIGGCKYGPGWYCTDNVEVFCVEGDCDSCAIDENCSGGASYDGNTWRCDDDSNNNGGGNDNNGSGNDNNDYNAVDERCYVHKGCETGIGFCNEECCDNIGGCKYGPGWYCTDNVEVFCVEGDCDACNIPYGCSYGKWGGSEWVCAS
eukprot:CAMPEP_0198241382 /NCGR_PEP_ID=MMETSP1446-20131203/6192_1 /TAXON_ID=1461542 ORGANISM="Unidentified sp, Strain CCMP2111" /NCGR_SAMPLE_ID=MMETSP1446 /ASSEMBLY_ACC=CAM_ASM_001112 /LENGTH=196 /DNA_ID=CAMNT_0043924217 /DNA_START=270 /DNA_END=860 /DNA_ORIENTATION=-